MLAHSMVSMQQHQGQTSLRQASQVYPYKHIPKNTIAATSPGEGGISIQNCYNTSFNMEFPAKYHKACKQTGERNSYTRGKSLGEGQTSDLADNDFKAVINLFKELKETMVKKVKKNRRIRPHHMQNSNEETKITKE